MIHTYTVKGDLGGGKAAIATAALKKHQSVKDVSVDEATKVAIVTLAGHVGMAELNRLLSQSTGEVLSLENERMVDASAPSILAKYKPLIAIALGVVVLTAMLSILLKQTSGMDVMRLFMAAFFLVFGSFKILNWRGFADAYAMYDIVAKRSRTYAFAYPLIELTLGVLFLFNIAPLWTNSATVLVMTVGSIGVAQALRRKEEIICACIGVVFKVPMTKVTLFENALMAAMALGMLASLL